MVCKDCLERDDLNEAAKQGHSKCLKYLYHKRVKEGTPIIWDELTSSYAAVSGNLKSLKFLYQKGCPWDEKTCANAAHIGSLECLKYSRENGCPWDESTCIEAAGKSHLDCIVYHARNHQVSKDIQEENHSLSKGTPQNDNLINQSKSSEDLNLPSIHSLSSGSSFSHHDVRSRSLQNTPRSCFISDPRSCFVSSSPHFNQNNEFSNLDHGLNQSNSNLDHGLNQGNSNLDHGLNQGNSNLDHDLNQSNSNLDHGLNQSNSNLDHGLNQSNSNLDHGLNQSNSNNVSQEISQSQSFGSSKDSSPGTVTPPWGKSVLEEKSRARSCQLACLEYAHKHNCPWNEDVCANACYSGNFKCLQYAHQNGCPCDPLCFCLSSYYHNYECLNYILENKCCGYEKYLRKFNLILNMRKNITFLTIIIRLKIIAIRFRHRQNKSSQKN